MKKFKRSHEQDIQNHMKRIMNLKSPFIFLLVAAIGASFFLGNNHNLVIHSTKFGDKHWKCYK